MNQLQAAYQHSAANHVKFPQWDLYHSLLMQGWSVVMREDEVTCRITDALLPSRTVLVGAFPNREAAIEYWYAKDLDKTGDHFIHHPLGSFYDDTMSSPVVGCLVEAYSNGVRKLYRKPVQESATVIDPDEIAF